MTNLGSILKSRDITLPTKFHLVKVMISPVVMYGCESWTIKKAEHWRIDAFELWFEDSWESLGQQGNPTSPFQRKSFLNIHWKDWCWSWNFNTLASWCKELTHLKRPWCWERLKAGGEGDDRGWDGWMASWTQWTCVWVNSRSCWWTVRPGVLQSVGSLLCVWAIPTWLSDWTELKHLIVWNLYLQKGQVKTISLLLPSPKPNLTSLFSPPFSPKIYRL